MSLEEQLADSILELEDVEGRPSRFGGGDAFWIGRREFAHFHPGEGEVDIRLTRKRIRQHWPALSEDPRIHRRRPGGDWIEFRFACEEDLPRALELVAQALEANRPDG